MSEFFVINSCCNFAEDEYQIGLVSHDNAIEDIERLELELEQSKKIVLRYGSYINDIKKADMHLDIYVSLIKQTCEEHKLKRGSIISTHFGSLVAKDLIEVYSNKKLRKALSDIVDTENNFLFAVSHSKSAREKITGQILCKEPDEVSDKEVARVISRLCSEFCDYSRIVNIPDGLVDHMYLKKVLKHNIMKLDPSLCCECVYIDGKRYKTEYEHSMCPDRSYMMRDVIAVFIESFKDELVFSYFEELCGHSGIYISTDYSDMLSHCSGTGASSKARELCTLNGINYWYSIDVTYVKKAISTISFLCNLLQLDLCSIKYNFSNKHERT